MTHSFVVTLVLLYYCTIVLLYYFPVKTRMMKTLQTLAVTALMALFKELFLWEDVEEKIMEMPGGWKTWIVEEELKKEWEKHQIKKKKALFKDVHQQLVSLNNKSVVA